MIAATRSRCGGLAILVALLCAWAMPEAGWSAVPGGFAVERVDGPTPQFGTLAGARTGETVISAGDMNGDGKDDFLVGAPSAAISPDITGRVFLFNHNGALIWERAAPSPQPPNISGSRPTRFGAGLARLGDIGSCATSGSTCTVGAKDGVSELLVAAPGTDTGGDAGEDEGVVYVLDGETGQFLKEVRLQAAERPQSGSAGLGQSLASLAAQPPCKGIGGLSDCAGSSAAAIGDVTGGGTPDFAVGAPDYAEVGGGETANCLSDVACPGLGRVYIVWGEAITGSAQTPLDLVAGETSTAIQSPVASDGTDQPKFGSALLPTGDVGSCGGDPGGGPACIGVPEALSAQPDGFPDLTATAPGAPTGGTGGAGAAFVLDPRANAAMLRIDSPTPQAAGAFGSFLSGFAAPGDLNLDGVPDLVLGAPGEGGGSAYMVSGNVAAGSVIRAYSDPSPLTGGNFGAALATLGDITGDGAGEVAAGAAGGSRAGSIHLLSACSQNALQTVTDPDAQADAAFGAGIAPVGDRNGDGMLDLVVGAPGFDGSVGQDQGRVYLLTSNGSIASVPSGCGASGGGTGGGTGGSGGSGGAVTPPKSGKVVETRVMRLLVMKPTRKRVRKFRSFRLRGALTASASRTVCQNRQKIALQRRRGGGRFQTFEVAVTRASGAFTARAIAERTYVYRARVSQTARCMGAVSKTARVSVLRSRGSR
jgi:hypothetical protein